MKPSKRIRQIKSHYQRFFDGSTFKGEYHSLYDDYDETQLPSAVKQYSLGVSTPTKFIRVESGETILDCGCGAGVDSILAAQLVGSHGLVIGIDISPNMVKQAQQNAYLAGVNNAIFCEGDIENLYLDNQSVDKVISNGVFYMLPDKRRSFQEVYRVLKEGGEVALSDIALKGSFSKDTYREVSHYLNDFDYCFRALDIQVYMSLWTR